MATSLQVNIGGINKDIDKGFVNIDGVWKTIDKIMCNIGGAWKDGYISFVFKLLGIPGNDYSLVTRDSALNTLNTIAAQEGGNNIYCCLDYQNRAYALENNDKIYMYSSTLQLIQSKTYTAIDASLTTFNYIISDKYNEILVSAQDYIYVLSADSLSLINHVGPLAGSGSARLIDNAVPCGVNGDKIAFHRFYYYSGEYYDSLYMANKDGTNIKSVAATNTSGQMIIMSCDDGTVAVIDKYTMKRYAETGDSTAITSANVNSPVSIGSLYLLPMKYGNYAYFKYLDSNGTTWHLLKKEISTGNTIFDITNVGCITETAVAVDKDGCAYVEGVVGSNCNVYKLSPVGAIIAQTVSSQYTSYCLTGSPFQ